jgi:hypothetical protein
VEPNWVPTGIAVDGGTAVYGISYVGAAPDVGAYEKGGTYWKAGADWTPFYDTYVPGPDSAPPITSRPYADDFEGVLSHARVE